MMEGNTSRRGGSRQRYTAEMKREAVTLAEGEYKGREAELREHLMSKWNLSTPLPKQTLCDWCQPKARETIVETAAKGDAGRKSIRFGRYQELEKRILPRLRELDESGLLTIDIIQDEARRNLPTLACKAGKDGNLKSPPQLSVGWASNLVARYGLMRRKRAMQLEEAFKTVAAHLDRDGGLMYNQRDVEGFKNLLHKFQSEKFKMVASTQPDARCAKSDEPRGEVDGENEQGGMQEGEREPARLEQTSRRGKLRPRRMSAEGKHLRGLPAEWGREPELEALGEAEQQRTYDGEQEAEGEQIRTQDREQEGRRDGEKRKTQDGEQEGRREGEQRSVQDGDQDVRGEQQWTEEGEQEGRRATEQVRTLVAARDEEGLRVPSEWPGRAKDYWKWLARQRGVGRKEGMGQTRRGVGEQEGRVEEERQGRGVGEQEGRVEAERQGRGVGEQEGRVEGQVEGVEDKGEEGKEEEVEEGYGPFSRVDTTELEGIPVVGTNSSLDVLVLSDEEEARLPQNPTVPQKVTFTWGLPRVDGPYYMGMTMSAKIVERCRRGETLACLWTDSGMRIVRRVRTFNNDEKDLFCVTWKMVGFRKGYHSRRGRGRGVVQLQGRRVRGVMQLQGRRVRGVDQGKRERGVVQLQGRRVRGVVQQQGRRVRGVLQLQGRTVRGVVQQQGRRKGRGRHKRRKERWVRAHWKTFRGLRSCSASFYGG